MKSWSSGQGGKHDLIFKTQIQLLLHKSQHMRIFVAKIATYVYFCHNICILLLQTSQHTHIQILCIIEELCTLLREKIVQYIILIEQE